MNKKLILITLFLFCFIFGNTLFAQYVSSTDKLPDHPRLLLLKGEEKWIKKRIATDKTVKSLDSIIIAESYRMLLLPIPTFGKSQLSEVREEIRRIFYLSYSYRMTLDTKFSTRVESEMLAISSYPWKTEHYLDIAEMCFALSIGYDWCYNKLSPQSRTSIEDAIQNIAINTTIGTNASKLWWLKATSNWTQVCQSGIAFGAVALWDKNPIQGAMLINRAIDNVQPTMGGYKNNGAYPEGYMYWNYGTSYNVLMINLIETLWKSNFGLTSLPGFITTGDFILNLEGPPTAMYGLPMKNNCDLDSYKMVNQPFDFSDAVIAQSHYPLMFWFGTINNKPSTYWNETTKLKDALKNNVKLLLSDRQLPMCLLWSKNVSFENAQVPTNKMYVGQGRGACATMRTSWTDPNAIFVGVKGGCSAAPHAHMDLGSFVMDAIGVRWSSDFGLQSYGTMDPNPKTHWNMLRCNNTGHSTLIINNNKQSLDATIVIEDISEQPDSMSVQMNLTNAYKNDVNNLKRKVSILNNKYVRVQDQITTGNKTDTIRWNMLTTSIPKMIDDKTILLKQNGKELMLTIVGDLNVKSKVWSTVTTNPYDASNKGYTFVGFEILLPPNSTKTISTYLTPIDIK